MHILEMVYTSSSLFSVDSKGFQTCLIGLNVRLACDHLFGKLLFTWLSLVMSMMVSFVLSFFPLDVLDEILNLIESVSEDFPSYSSIIAFCKAIPHRMLN